MLICKKPPQANRQRIKLAIVSAGVRGIHHTQEATGSARPDANGRRAVASDDSSVRPITRPSARLAIGFGRQPSDDATHNQDSRAAHRSSLSERREYPQWVDSRHSALETPPFTDDSISPRDALIFRGPNHIDVFRTGHALKPPLPAPVHAIHPKSVCLKPSQKIGFEHSSMEPSPKRSCLIGLTPLGICQQAWPPV